MAFASFIVSTQMHDCFQQPPYFNIKFWKQWFVNVLHDDHVNGRNNDNLKI